MSRLIICSELSFTQINIASGNTVNWNSNNRDPMLNGTFGPNIFYFSNLNGTNIYELRGLDYIARACI